MPIPAWLLLVLAVLLSEDVQADTDVRDPAIWDTSAARLVTPEELMRHAVRTDILLLGETHDNAAHHAVQAQIVRHLLDQGRRPALVMEQFDTGQQEEIERILAGQADPPTKLQRLLAAMGPGWDKAAYADILRVGIDASLPVVAANLSRASAREVSRNGPDALRDIASNDLMIESVWDDAKDEATRMAIQQGHCGMLPDAAVRGMVLAQRARDAIMADRLLRQTDSGAVAIVGRGHVLKTTAVPLYLRARQPSTSVLAIGLMETDHPGAPPESARASLAADYDFVWLTPAAARNGDPCADFKAPSTPPPAR